MKQLRRRQQSYSRRHGMPKKRQGEINLFVLSQDEGQVVPDNNIVQYLAQDYETASPEDMVVRHEYQLQRYRDLRFSNELTPQWRKFGRRHESEF